MIGYSLALKVLGYSGYRLRYRLGYCPGDGARSACSRLLAVRAFPSVLEGLLPALEVLTQLDQQPPPVHALRTLSYPTLNMMLLPRQPTSRQDAVNMGRRYKVIQHGLPE